LYGTVQSGAVIEWSVLIFEWNTEIILNSNPTFSIKNLSFKTKPNMPKTSRRQLSEGMLNRIVALVNAGHSYAEIGRLENIPKSTVQKATARIRQTGSITPYKRSGRSKKWSAQDSRKLERIVTKDAAARVRTGQAIQEEFNTGLSESKSLRTIQSKLNELGFYNLKAIRKPYVNEYQANRRLEWCRSHRNWTVDDWRKVIFSDETSFEVGKRRSRNVWRKSTEKLNPDCMQGSVKSGRVTRMYWGCFMDATPGPLTAVTGRMDSDSYISILRTHLTPFLNGDDRLEAALPTSDERLHFQQDNAPCHSSRKTRQWFREQHVRLLSWPGQSPDLNPIENLWAYLKTQVQKRKPKNVVELDEIVHEEWSKLDDQILTNLVESMPRRIQAVIEAKGYPSKY